MSRSPHRKRREARVRRRSLPGAPSGVLIPDPAAPDSKIQVIAFGPDDYVEDSIDNVQSIPAYLERWPVIWVNVDGLGDTATIEELGRIFGLHRLALEDAVHVHQRAKLDSFGSHLFMVARMPIPDCGETEQVSLFLGPNFLVSFQERPGGDCLEPVRLRIRTGVGKARRCGTDFLLYAILDTIIDYYFPLVERAGDQLDALESDVLNPAHREIMTCVHDVKRSLLGIRRAIWPLRDALNALIRDDTRLIADETRVYLRDCHDHTIQILDLVDASRDMAGSLQEIYLASLSQRTSEIVRVLTVISTIFIPLTFVVGIYGMNFDADSSPWNMPELRWYWGYPAVMLGMLAAACGLLAFFWRRGWIGYRSAVDDANNPADVPNSTSPQRKQGTPPNSGA